jgi:hypothetical protein
MFCIKLGIYRMVCVVSCEIRELGILNLLLFSYDAQLAIFLEEAFVDGVFRFVPERITQARQVIFQGSLIRLWNLNPRQDLSDV